MASGPNAGPTVEFRNNPSYFLAREALQNSVDAWNPKSKNPVKVIFDVKEIDASSLPGAQEMTDILNACAKYLDSKGSSDMAKELKSGAKMIEQNKKISVLRISDYNTVGMTDENWFRFGESVGFSNKGSGSGGSFGLGKGAYYSASGFFSIFTSSLYCNSQFRFSGKAILTTFELNGQRKQNNGTYGLEGQKSISNIKQIPQLFKDSFKEVFGRELNGTDFMIPQFIGEENWEEELTKSILRFFWLPIHQGKLVVEINNKHYLNAESLEENLVKHFSHESSEKVNAQKPNPLPFYKAYTEGVKHSDEVDGLGIVNLYILARDGYPNRIALIRKAGMVVDFLRKVSMNNFSAVFICEDEEGNKLLREMENQEHNEWNPMNAKTKESRDRAQKAYDELDAYLKAKIQGLNASVEQRYLQLEGLDKYISMETEEGEGNSESDSGKEKNIESADVASVEDVKTLTLEEKIKPLKISMKPEMGSVDGDDEADTIKEGDNGNGKYKKKHKKDIIESGGLKLKPIKEIQFESFAEKVSANKYVHHIIVKGKPSAMINELLIRVGTDDNSEVVTIKSAKVKDTGEKCVVEKWGGLKDLKLDKKGFLHVLVDFEENDKFSLKILGYENR